MPKKKRYKRYSPQFKGEALFSGKPLSHFATSRLLEGHGDAEQCDGLARRAGRCFNSIGLDLTNLRLFH